MRTIILPIAALFFSLTAHAQITAGEVPPGQFAYNTPVDLGLNINFTADSGGLEFDCDDAMDGWAILRRGYPGIDAPNSAELRSYGDEIEVCMNTATGFLQRPRYYSFGQVLDCTGAYEWHSVSTFTLGDFGGFGAIGPSMVDSAYIAYRQDGVTGWMRLSFDLVDDEEITLQVHTVLSICGGSTSMGQRSEKPTVTLFPNPTDGTPVRVEVAGTIQRIELLDLSGRIITERTGVSTLVEPPDVAGTYLVRVIAGNGWSATLPVVRY